VCVCVCVCVCMFTACLSDIYYEVSVYPEIQIGNSSRTAIKNKNKNVRETATTERTLDLYRPLPLCTHFRLPVTDQAMKYS